jgi:hypothetical protein
MKDQCLVDIFECKLNQEHQMSWSGRTCLVKHRIYLVLATLESEHVQNHGFVIGISPNLAQRVRDGVEEK